MFMTDLTTKYRNPDGTWKPEFDPFKCSPIPSFMRVYGIGYDGAGIIIYALFPRYEVKESKLQWGFCCTEVVTQYRSDFAKYSTTRRVEVLRALLIVLDRAWSLTEKLCKEYTLDFPLELRKLDELWATVA
ncbi:hypothetical protein A0H81_12885 [Grifola frondosa]|uniref:Uncharacterized protein n=1 Tax=Grifola frondosa TaxID=5627 RepID=A0A1C7LQH5_GRIFR|nr:hypothetical protein A0H81_12885 [Grifola frondosa]